MTIRLPCQLLATLCLFALSASAFAVGDNEPPANSVDVAKEEFARGRAAIESGQWDRAIATFSGVVSREPGNASAWNWLGYANRKSGKLDAAFKAYDKALTIDPAHRGAHEYVGEAWLMADQPEKAEAHLAILARLCNARCKEYEDLKKALAAYRATGKAQPGRW